MPTLTPNTRLCPNGDEIAAKILDGEAIIINLATGSYYSMEKAGALIWEKIERGCSLAEVTAALGGRYDGAAGQIEADVERIAAELLQEGLVKVSSAEPLTPQTGPPPAGAKAPYEPPHLTAFSDMRDLLALDPPPPALEDVPWKDPTGGSSNSSTD